MDSVRRNKSLIIFEFQALNEEITPVVDNTEEIRIKKLEEIRKSRAALVEECQILEQQNDQLTQELIHKEVNDITKKRAALTESGQNVLQLYNTFDPSVFSEDEQKMISQFQERLKFLTTTNSLFFSDPTFIKKYMDLTENQLKLQLQTEYLKKEKQLLHAPPGFCEHLLNEKKSNFEKEVKQFLEQKECEERLLYNHRKLLHEPSNGNTRNSTKSSPSPSIRRKKYPKKKL